MRGARRSCMCPAGSSCSRASSFLLVNNVHPRGVAGLVLWGTLSPLVYELFGLGKISVGPPVFAVMFLVPMLPLDGISGRGHAFGLAARQATVPPPGRWAGWPWRPSCSRSWSRRWASAAFHWVGLVGFVLRILGHVLGPARTAPAAGGSGHRLTRAMLGMAVAHIGVGCSRSVRAASRATRSKRTWP